MRISDRALAERGRKIEEPVLGDGIKNLRIKISQTPIGPPKPSGVEVDRMKREYKKRKGLLDRDP